jgi:hypothetical protein
MTKILAAQLTGYQQALSGLAYFQIDELQARIG